MSTATIFGITAVVLIGCALGLGLRWICQAYARHHGWLPPDPKIGISCWIRGGEWPFCQMWVTPGMPRTWWVSCGIFVAILAAQLIAFLAG